MGKQFDHITPKLCEFIERQQMFTVATAMSDGRVNLSPKGMDTLRVENSNRVVWLNLTGSGNETAAHLLDNNRMTIMFCAFEGNPLILRLYGHAKVYHPREPEFETHVSAFPPMRGVRQVIEMDVDLVQSSCGFGVPEYEFRGQRSKLEQWMSERDDEAIVAYWREKNRVSLDGRETGIV